MSMEQGMLAYIIHDMNLLDLDKKLRGKLVEGCL